MAKKTRAFSQSKIIKGIEAGAANAIHRARETGTNLIVYRKGRVVDLAPNKVRMRYVQK